MSFVSQVRFSGYVPASTWMVWASADASIASWIRSNGCPGLPSSAGSLTVLSFGPGSLSASSSTYQVVRLMLMSTVSGSDTS